MVGPRVQEYAKIIGSFRSNTWRFLIYSGLHLPYKRGRFRTCWGRLSVEARLPSERSELRSFADCVKTDKGE